MKVETEVQFKIGDKVKVKYPHAGSVRVSPFIATIGGYVIHKTDRNTRVYYTLKKTGDYSFDKNGIEGYNVKKRYFASELELVE